MRFINNPGEKKIRVLMAKPGFDGHWKGAIIISTALRDAGMEVIFAGNQSPREIVEAALQEDVEVIGLSILSASHLKLLPDIPRLLREKGVKDIVVVAGGTIPREDIPYLKETGIDEVFPPGSKLESIVKYVKERVSQKRG